MNKHLNTWFLLILFPCAGISVAQDSSLLSVEVTIHCTPGPGLPVPVMTLERSEVEEYRRLLSQFVELREDEKEVYRSASYRGMQIVEWSAGDRLARRRTSGVRVYDNIIIDERQPYGYKVGWWRSRLMAPDNALERYILGLARDKGVISEDDYLAILNNVLEVAPQKQDPMINREAIMAMRPSRLVTAQIHCTSGVPNPVITLEESELSEYRWLLGQFVALQEDEEEGRQMLSWYGGMTIRDSGSDDNPVHFLLYGRRILNDRPQMDEYDGPLYFADRIAPDNSLERYLLSLAQDKGLIPDNICQMILKDVQEKSERGRIRRRYSE
jgi:hypothetical protein